MNDEEFKKYVELITSMSIDYIIKKELTRETYLANLKTMVRIMEENG